MRTSKIVCCGSLNLDYVYEVEEFCTAGTTVSAKSFSANPGGKGLNQAVACARAGANVAFVGNIGADGETLLSTLKAESINCEKVSIVPGPSGHAVIQVRSDGTNSILVCAGANATLSSSTLESCMSILSAEDILLLQNETNLVPELMKAGKKGKAKIAFNPSPITKEIKSYPLGLLDFMILNEHEALQLSAENNIEAASKYFCETLPMCEVVITLAEQGSIYIKREEHVFMPALKVDVVDTTAAGDCFMGYYLASRLQHLSTKDCLIRATQAASLCVGKNGAAGSIPKI
jgi:ribokinase